MTPSPQTNPITLPTIEDLTRREFISSALAAALLIACGDDEDGGDRETLVIDDAFGPVTVPVNPERLLAADEITFGNMLALGIQPLGGAWYSAELAGHLQAKVEGEQPVNLVASDEFDMEQALALEPDLIVTTDWDPGFCDELKAGAPTYCYPYGYTTKEEIFGNLNGTARATSRQDAAENLIKQYEERIESLREDAANRGWDSRPVAILYFNGGLSSMYITGTGVATAALHDMGIPRTERTRIGEDIELTPERLRELDDAYALIAYGWGEDTWRAEVEANPVWRQLKVVQEGRVLWTDGPAWYGYDMLAVFAVLDDLEQKLLPLAQP